MMRLKPDIYSYLRCHFLRRERILSERSKSGVIADNVTPSTVRDNAVARLEAADLLANFDDRARKQHCKFALATISYD